MYALIDDAAKRFQVLCSTSLLVRCDKRFIRNIFIRTDLYLGDWEVENTKAEFAFRKESTSIRLM